MCTFKTEKISNFSLKMKKKKMHCFFTLMLLIFLKYGPIQLQNLKKFLQSLQSNQNTKIAHLAKRGFFGAISLEWFLSPYYSLSCCKVLKISLEWMLRYWLPKCWATLDQNSSFGPKDIFWEISPKWFLFYS